MNRNGKWEIPRTVLGRQIQELQIKSKSMMCWNLRKKKEGIFCTVYFVRMEIFLALAFYLSLQHIEYTMRIYILLRIKNQLLHTFLVLPFKIVESLQYIFQVEQNSDFMPSFCMRKKSTVAVMFILLFQEDNKDSWPSIFT